MSEKPFELAGSMPHGTVVLEASAGTGKTFAIAHLFLRFVADESMPIERILVVTFTTAAAAELRERIRLRLRRAEEALRIAAVAAREVDAMGAFREAAGPEIDPTLGAWALEWAQRRDPSVARSRIALALASFDQHRIGTIHGFCQRILGRHAFESGADFEAELVNEIDALCREAAHDFLASCLARGEPALEDRPSKVLTVAHLQKLAKSALASPHANVFPEARPVATDFDRERLRIAHAAMRDAWHRDRASIRTALAEAVEAGATGAGSSLGNPEKWERTFRKIHAELSTLAPTAREISTDVERLAAVRENTLLKKGKTREAWVARFDHGFFEAFERFVLARDSHLAYLDARELACLHEFVAFARGSIAEQKKRAQQRTFDDLLRLLDDALAAPSGELLAARIRTEIRVALIDEFQDTDPTQWSIFQRVFHRKDRTLLLIGDPKQAIYGFRGADLETYLRARREADACYSLATNHRSDGALIAALERVYTTASAPFGPPHEDGRDQVSFVRVKAAAPESRIRVGGRAPTPIRLFGVDAPEPEDGGWSSDEGSATETDVGEEVLHAVAADVAAFLRSDACLLESGASRPIRPSDCAVLVRSHASARQIQRDLRRLGVAAVVRTDASVYATDEARELELVLEAALHPTDRGMLASALATDIVGATLGEIAEIETDEAKLDERYEQFRLLGEILRDRGFASFYREMLAIFQVPTRLLSRSDGERRVANLHQLCELLHAVAEQEHLGPQALVARLERFRAEEGSPADDRRIRLESDSDAVDIVTMHVSKGLEWGAVWCASLGNEPKIKDDAAHVLRDVSGVPSLHLGPRSLIDARPDVRDRILLGQRTEELRLAYVALTRARHLLNVFVPKRCKDDPFKQLFLEGEGRRIHVGDAKKATSSDALVVPDMAAAAAAIESSLAGTVAVARPGDFPPRVVADGEVRERTYGSRVFTRGNPLDVHWRITSYTALSAQAGGDRERVRYDEETAESVPSIISEDDTPWAGVAGGKELGVEVHETLERTQAFTVEELGATLARVRRVSDSQVTAGKTVPNDTLASLLHEALSTPLLESDPELTIASLPMDQVLREATFSLPVGGGRLSRAQGSGLSSRALAAVFREHDRPTMPGAYAARAESLALSPELRGFLVGAIDLVFEHRGLVYVADYKTTRLGPTLAEFARDSLPVAMMEHDYTLQALIYALAVHRHLAGREPGYDYDARFGGVMHLFLRAMSPTTGPSCGVYLDRPPRAQIVALSKALGLEEKGR